MIRFLWPLLFLVGLGGGFYLAKSAERKPTQLTDTGPTLEKVQELSELVVLRQEVSNVLEGTSNTSTIVVLVRGDCDIGVDLQHLKIVDRDPVAKKCKLLVPTPTLIRPRVDHSRTRVYKCEKTTFIPWRDDRAEAYKEAMQEAQRLVEYDCSRTDLIDRAKRRTEQLIVDFYRMFGWSVEVSWQ